MRGSPRGRRVRGRSRRERGSLRVRVRGSSERRAVEWRVPLF